MSEGDEDSPQTIRHRKCFIPCRSGADDEDSCHDMQCCIDEHDHDEDDDGHSHHGGHSHHHQREKSNSHFESTSFNNSSLSSAVGVLAGPSRLKSESMNNHLDMSMDSMNVSGRHEGGGSGAGASLNISNNSNGLGGGRDEDDSEDDEEIHAELRPMI